METSIHILTDDCLLDIFDYLNLHTMANCEQVCSRWKQLLQRRWKQFTMVNLNDPMFCYGKPAVQKKSALIHTSKVETLMRKIGSNLRSVVVGNCYERPVICVRNRREEFIFRIWGKFDPQDLIKILPETCTNLSVLKIKNSPKSNVELTAHWVQQLVENCQDLRAIVLSVPLGSVDVASFLRLPWLEHLSVTGAQFFSPISFNVDISSAEFNILNVLEVEFDSDGLLDCSGLFDVIERMPALDYVYVNGLPENEATQLTCKAIASRVNDRDIIVAPDSESDYGAMTVFKDVNPDVDPEPLRLMIQSPERDYNNIIKKFVSELEGCSVTPHNDYVAVPEWHDESCSTNSYCKCLYGEESVPSNLICWESEEEWRLYDSINELYKHSEKVFHNY